MSSHKKNNQSDFQKALPSWTQWLLIISLFAPVIVGLTLSWHSLSDFDVWLHQRVGQDILSGGGIPHSNTFSFVSTDQAWLDHEWLFQLAIAGSSSTSGISFNPMPWHFLRISIITGLLLLLIYRDNLKREYLTSHGHGWITWLGIPVLAGIHILWPRLILRPELLSYLAFVVLIKLLEKLAKPELSAKDSYKILGAVFSVVLLWAQLHGFSAMAPVMVLLAIITAAIGPVFGLGKPKGPYLKNLSLALGLSILALALTPNGVSGLLYPLKALGQFSNSGPGMSQTISELVPLLETKGSLGQTQLVFKLSLVWSVIWIFIQWGRLNLLRVVLWLLAAAAALSMQRAIGLYAIAFIMLHMGLLNTSGKGMKFGKFKLPGGLAMASAGTAITLILAVLWSVQIINDSFYLAEGVSRRFGTGLTPALYPVKSAQSLNTHGSQRVLANIDAAGYLLANTPAKLFIDGRTEAYAPKYWSLYNDLKPASEKSLKIIRNMKPDGIVLTIGSGAFLKLAKVLVDGSEWQLASLDESALYFIPTSTGFKAGDNLVFLRNRINPLESAISKEMKTGTARKADRYLAVARLWTLANDPNAALRCYGQGLDSYPNHPPLHHNQGNILMDHKDFKRALDHFQTALSINSRLAPSALNAGVCLMNLKNPVEAEKMFEQCISIDDKSFEGWANLGVSRISQNKKQEAQKALIRALEIRPGERNLQKMLRNLKKQR